VTALTRDDARLDVTLFDDGQPRVLRGVPKPAPLSIRQVTGVKPPPPFETRQYRRRGTTTSYDDTRTLPPATTPTCANGLCRTGLQSKFYATDKSGDWHYCEACFGMMIRAGK